MRRNYNSMNESVGMTQDDWREVRPEDYDEGEVEGYIKNFDDAAKALSCKAKDLVNITEDNGSTYNKIIKHIVKGDEGQEVKMPEVDGATRMYTLTNGCTIITTNEWGYGTVFVKKSEVNKAMNESLIMNESVSGPLAKALNQASQKSKNDLIYALRKSNIDFNRSIGQAEKITATDPRLSVEGNIVIGIFTDANDRTCMTAYKIGSGPIVDSTASITMVRDNSGKVVNLPNFANVSWKKWISIMTDFYIIEKDKAVEVNPLTNQRRSNKNMNNLDVSETWTNKVKEIANRYGYEIYLYKYVSGRRQFDTRIDLTNKDRSSHVGVRHDPKDGFMINTTGSTWTESEAIKMRDDMTKAIDMAHKLNQINLDKVGNIGDYD